MKQDKGALTVVWIVGSTTLLSVILALLAVSIVGSYGWGVFVVVPLICGALIPLFYGRGERVAFGDVAILAALSGIVSCLGLVVLGIEGLICVVMALPLVAPLYLIGAAIGCLLLRLLVRSRSLLPSAGLLCLLPFAVISLEGKKASSQLREITTEIVIRAPVDKVWKEVIAFSPIPKPTEIWFRAGIAYPTHAEIEGTGVGAIRRCHFSTGAFVEPITEWEEGRILSFDVIEQPKPMIELSPWGVHPPHLDSAIVSERGRFELIPLADGRTKLVGTTWLRIHMAPEPYWAYLTERLIHSIHYRVLRHIANSAEANSV